MRSSNDYRPFGFASVTGASRHDIVLVFCGVAAIDQDKVNHKCKVRINHNYTIGDACFGTNENCTPSAEPV